MKVFKNKSELWQEGLRYAICEIGAIVILSIVIAAVIFIVVYGCNGIKMLVKKSECTECTKATVLCYENALLSNIAIGANAYTVVETNYSNGKVQEVKLKGLYGQQAGDVLELFYEPDNKKNFYIGKIQYVSTPPELQENKLDAIFNAILPMLIITCIISYCFKKADEYERNQLSKRRCKWEQDDFCVNADCEHCADFCVTDYEGNFPCEHFEEADEEGEQ